VPAILRPGAHRLWNVYSTLYVVTLPIIAGALVSTAIGDLPPRELVIVVAVMLLLWGAADLWDDTMRLACPNRDPNRDGRSA
jgi:hypothetical protein